MHVRACDLEDLDFWQFYEFLGFFNVYDFLHFSRFPKHVCTCAKDRESSCMQRRIIMTMAAHVAAIVATQVYITNNPCDYHV